MSAACLGQIRQIDRNKRQIDPRSDCTIRRPAPLPTEKQKKKTSQHGIVSDIFHHSLNETQSNGHLFIDLLIMNRLVNEVIHFRVTSHLRN